MQIKKVLFCAVLLLAASCGYRFEGGGYIQNDIVEVAVNVFENKSSETGAGIVFTNALVREILTKTNTKIGDDPSVTAVLKGRINTITFSILSRSSTESVTERRVTASVDVWLVDQEGEEVWRVDDFNVDETYTVSADKVTDEFNKQSAVEQISTRMAEKLVSRLLTNF